MGEVTVTVRKWYATYNDDYANSHKFYEILLVPGGEDCYYELRRWGRIGSSGQFTVNTHYNQTAASSSAVQQAHAKAVKGYNSVGWENVTLTENHIAAIIGGYKAPGVPKFDSVEEAEAWLESRTLV